MNITLTTTNGDTLAIVPITTDEHGYLYAEHPDYVFELDCALAGYHEGLSTGTIDSDFDFPAVTWSIA